MTMETAKTGTPSTDEIVEAVRQDVLAGIGHLLNEVEFRPTGPFAHQRALVDGPFAAVQWTFEGVDCCDGFGGMWNTGKCVEVRGLTVVDMSGDTILFQRHIDWNAVNSQLGGSRGRTAGDADYVLDFKTARNNAEQAYTDLMAQRGQ